MAFQKISKKYAKNPYVSGIAEKLIAIQLDLEILVRITVLIEFVYGLF